MSLQRLVLIAIMSMASARVVAAQPGKAGNPLPPPRLGDDLDRPSLSAAVIEQAVTPYLAGVRGCYLAQVRSARAGHVRLELVIQSNGSVARIAVVAPGASSTERRRLDGCLRAQIAKWHFPVRRGATAVIIPFYFQRTVAAGAGVQRRGFGESQPPHRSVGPGEDAGAALGQSGAASPRLAGASCWSPRGCPDQGDQGEKERP